MNDAIVLTHGVLILVCASPTHVDKSTLGGLNERVASHLRVAVRSVPGGAIDYWPNHPYADEYGSMMWRLRKQSRSRMERKGGYHQLFVSGDELIERNPSNLF